VPVDDEVVVRVILVDVFRRGDRQPADGRHHQHAEDSGPDHRLDAMRSPSCPQLKRS
jgi:hypothetical protein